MNANNDKGATNVANDTPAALLPCAHCGSVNVWFSNDYDTDGHRYVFVKCGGCRAQSHATWSDDPCSVTYAELREAWNRRATTAPGASESCVEGLADEWFAAFVRPVAQLLRCLPAYFPAGNEHILRKLRELVGASESRGSVPDGFVLVPREATDDMLSAGHDALDSGHKTGAWGECPGVNYGDARRCFAAMLAAAPTPPAVSNEEGAFTARVVEWKGIRFGVPA